MLKGIAAALVLIEVSDEAIEAGRPFTDKSTGMVKPAVAKQKCYLHSGNRYPVGFKQRVDDASGPHRPGFYLLAGDVFKPGEYDGLKFNDRQLQLVPLAQDVLVQLGELIKPPVSKVA